MSPTPIEDYISDGPKMEIRGHTSFNRPASLLLLFLAALVDVSLVLTLTLVFAKFFSIPPLPSLSLLGLIVASGLLYGLPQVLLFQISLGQKTWGLQRRSSKLFPAKDTLKMCDSLGFQPLMVSILITLTALGASWTSIQRVVLNDPLWLSATPWTLAPFVPSTPDWLVAPFFYVTGGWPKKFDDKAIFYTLSYEQGPPVRFIGHTTAAWASPDIKLVLEGPKTPEGRDGRDKLKTCILKNEISLNCLKTRDLALSRHIDDLQNAGARTWTLKWFSVSHPSVPQENQPQGVYLSAAGVNAMGAPWIQDRFILINNHGVHQAVILNRPPHSKGQEAFELIQKSIGSLRCFNELDSGRAWVNQALEQVRLPYRAEGNLALQGGVGPLRKRDGVENPVPTIGHPDLQGRVYLPRGATSLAEIQSLLISKISVDPASYESYFHLAGTSLLLAKTLSQTEKEERVQGLRIALHNLQSAYLFAQDLAPKDPRTLQIRALLTEAKKL